MAPGDCLKCLFITLHVDCRFRTKDLRKREYKVSGHCSKYIYAILFKIQIFTSFYTIIVYIIYRAHLFFIFLMPFSSCLHCYTFIFCAKLDRWKSCCEILFTTRTQWPEAWSLSCSIGSTICSIVSIIMDVDRRQSFALLWSQSQDHKRVIPNIESNDRIQNVTRSGGRRSVLS